MTGEDGLTPAQESADAAFTAVSGRMAAAWPLPGARFLTGIGGGERHAIDRVLYEERRRSHWSGYTRGECGRPVLYASMFPVYGQDLSGAAAWCAECAWSVAAREGDLERQARALVPSPDDHVVLARLMKDPLIAATAAASIVEAVTSGYGDYEPGDREILRVLAAISRHAPVILVAGDCADGGCAHDPGSDPHPCAAVACGACSLQAGPEAGEREGRYLDACTITAPCAPLVTLAVHAAKMLAEVRRREQELAGTTITRKDRA